MFMVMFMVIVVVMIVLTYIAHDQLVCTIQAVFK